MSFLESRNPFLRKGFAYAYQSSCRPVVHLLSQPKMYADAPAIVVNSVPKSGTHLLMQLARSISRTRYYGGFVSHAWSVTMRERNIKQIISRLKQIVPREVVGAHIYYDARVSDFFRLRPVLHLFIYRDPRDVALSEAHYLANMSPWHRLHRSVRSLPTMDARVRAMIEGIPGMYPDIGVRLRRFIGWINDPGVVAIRYEDLLGTDRQTTLANLAALISQRAPFYGSAACVAQRMEEAIRPGESHTFHEGGTEKWRTRLSPENRELILEVAGKEIADMGYPLS